jgi:hypothetical protein
MLTKLVNGERIAMTEYEAAEFVASQGRPAPTEEMVREEAAQCLEEMARLYTRQERETWHVQVPEAEALKADATAPAPLLRQLAAEDNVTPVAFANHVLGKHLAMATVAGAILAAQRRLIGMDPIPADYAQQLKAAATAATPAE